MRRAIYSFAALVAGAGLVSAQVPQVSPACQTAAQDIVSSPLADCANPLGFVLVLVGKQQDLTKNVDSWLTGMCPKAPCNETSLEFIFSKLTTGCAAELGTTQADALNVVKAVYPGIRRILCLKNGNQLCVTETLTNYEQNVGPIGSLPDGIAKFGRGDPSIPKSVFCTSCVKAAFNIARNQLAKYLPASIDNTLSQQCGADFIDKKTPPGISQSASGASMADAGFALSASDSLRLGLSALVSIAGVLMMFG